MKFLTQPAQIIGLIASAMMIIAIQVKDKKSLFLVFNILGKTFFGINYAILGEFAGTVTQIISLVITVIAYIYTKKNISIPKWMSFLFIISIAGAGAVTCERAIGIVAIICGITYALIVSSKNMKIIRKLNFVQSLLWTIYDYIIGAYTASAFSAVVFISTVVAIYRYDIKNNNEVE